MEKDMIISGVHIGEHTFRPEAVLEELWERCVKPGYRFVTIRTGYNNNRPVIAGKYFLQWAKYLADNKVYFVFLYTLQHAPDGHLSALTKETVAKIKEIAGEYFLGDMIGETGASHACKFPGYYNQGFGPGKDPTHIRTDHADMKAAAEAYMQCISEYVKNDRKLGLPYVLAVEPTCLHKYNAMAGVDIPMLEMMCANPDIAVPCVRGVARAFGAKLWGTYIAHEWYGGVRHTDPLKRKRLEMSYKYAYLSGSNTFCLESGDEAIESYGCYMGKDTALCEEYRQVQDRIADYIQKDARPKGGPKVRLAFVSGMYDGFGGWGGSTVWNQFDREEWHHGEAEHSWRLIEEIGKKRDWTDIANYGECDFSALPGYGMYDILPIEADKEVFSRYDYLIFTGWNSMTEENLDKLIAYVENGGHLLLCAAHLNCQTKRDGPFIWPNGDKLRKLFVASFSGETYQSNFGVIFTHAALDENALYPGTPDRIVDPLYSAGTVTYAKLQPEGCHIAGGLGDTFLDVERNLPVIIENRCGKGIATLVASVNYPGHPAVYPLYRAVARELVTMSARTCELQVLGNDRLRYAVYAGDELYLLNTDFDLPITVRILYRGKEIQVTLEALEMKHIVLPEQK